MTSDRRQSRRARPPATSRGFLLTALSLAIAAATIASAGTPESVPQQKINAEDSIRDLPGWWSARTQHYILLSNLPPSKRSVALRLQREIDPLHKAFRRLIPPHAPISDAGIIRIFATPEEYREYVPKRYSWTSGIWMPGKGELVINPTKQEYRRVASRILPTVYHEALHQYIFSVFRHRTPSPWYNEGHASLFESIRFTEHNEPRLMEHDQHLAILRSLAQQDALDIPRLLSFSYEDFYASERKQRQQNYATAWGLVYFLHKAAAIEPGRPYAGIIEDYASHLRSSQSPVEATDKTFARVDMSAFADTFTSFWLSAKRRRKAEQNLILR